MDISGLKNIKVNAKKLYENYKKVGRNISYECCLNIAAQLCGFKNLSTAMHYISKNNLSINE